MRHPFDRYTRLLDLFYKGVELSVGMTVIATVGVISYGVLAREVLHLSDVWVTEVTTYLMAYMTFVGTSALAWQSRHLQVDVLGHCVGARARRVLAFASALVVAAVALVVAVLAVEFWWDAWTSGERSWGMFSLPLWIPYLCLVAGSVMLVLAQLSRLLAIAVTGARSLRHDTLDELALGREK
ncbi:TRAP transporter small permease [Paraburkholderia lycopersici]|uniref:TRAP transporter small permease protein n=1 Tax=Paraburkholderia lycopersici TaxID=416944 RepID=A0A1G6TTB8_9BURK|nr:TRAP transporter small permease subunit [Paraburkholderia lycopersici]SDD31627.1 TRAP-type C4-dicarboxylate transport system, small permease component [Paraburkholderia lycopersici]